MKTCKAMLVGAVVLTMAACASFGQNVAYSCAGLTTALETLTEARRMGKLSESTIDRVDTAIEVVDPYCGSPTRPTMTDAAATAFDQARNILLAELDKVEE